MPDLEILCRAIWILASSTTLSPQRTDLQTTHSQDPSRCLARRSLQNSILGYRRLMNSLSCDNNERSYRQPHPPPPLNTRIARLTATTAASTSTPPWSQYSLHARLHARRARKRSRAVRLAAHKYLTRRVRTQRPPQPRRRRRSVQRRRGGPRVAPSQRSASVPDLLHSVPPRAPRSDGRNPRRYRCAAAPARSIAWRRHSPRWWDAAWLRDGCTMLGSLADALCWLEMGWTTGVMRGLYVALHVFERGPCPESPLLLPAIFSLDEIGSRVRVRLRASIQCRFARRQCVYAYAYLVPYLTHHGSESGPLDRNG